MRWSTVLPIDQPTGDGRVLHAVRLDRPWPLPLMLNRTTETTFARTMPTGQITHADIGRTKLWLAGTIDGPPWMYDHTWYAVCDLVDTTILEYHSWFRRRLQMTGTLAAMTLVDRPAWRHQRPVVFSP